jgi:hypothetical protein
VEGGRLLDPFSEPLLGWARYRSAVGWKDVTVRPAVNHWRPVLRRFDGISLRRWSDACAKTLALGHARSGDPVLLGAYLGRSEAFDRAMVAFVAHLEAEAKAGAGAGAGHSAPPAGASTAT